MARTYTVTEYDREDYTELSENMTDEEAVALLERIERGWIPDYNFDGSEGDFYNYKLHVALYKAIEKLQGKTDC